MQLSQYQTVTQSLIQSPQSPIPLLPTTLLTEYINIARAQVALEGECVRTTGSATIASGLAQQPLSGLVLPPGAGYEQALVARNAVLDGVRVDIRPWDWFWAYNYFSPRTTPVMSHLGEGTASILYISSLLSGSLVVDVVALPINLAIDSDPDAIPYPFSDAVPFYTAYYSYMAFQRQADADMFMMRYRDLMRRARPEATSTNLPDNDPGGMGAMLAAARIVLGQPPAPPAQRGGR